MNKKRGKTIGIILFYFFFILPTLDAIFEKLFPDYEIINYLPLYLLISLLVLLLILFVDGLLCKSTTERKSTYFHLRLFIYFILIILGITYFILRLLKKL